MMSADEPASSKKRSLEAAGLDGDTPRPDADDSQPHPPTRKNAKVKNTKLPTSRRQAREAHQGQPARRGTRPEGQTPPPPQGPPRLPKRQCALLIGFCGAGYSGMQFQPHSRTIEGTLFDALVRAGAVSRDNADSINKVNFSRAARTDAGVHAAGNLVAMKLITHVPGVPDLVARVNEELPPEIRLWGFERVLKSFNARNTCDSRKYTYYFPSYLLLPPKPGSALHETLSAPSSHPFWASSTQSPPAEDLARKRRFRAPQEAVESLRELAQRYVGSRNFHNFTVGRDHADRSCVRIMKKIEVAEPVVHGETEWVSVVFHGQSFMLHQRKMMTALVLCCRTQTPPQIIDELYGPRTVFVPKMPALGLLLEYPIFESYNRRLAESMAQVEATDPEYRRPVDFEAHREKIDKFKQEHIYSRMRGVEEQGGVFDAWIRSVDAYVGNDLLYLNAKGAIPEEAVIRRIGKRPNPFREKKRFDATTFAADVGKEEEGDAEEDASDEETLDKKKLADMEG